MLEANATFADTTTSSNLQTAPLVTECFSFEIVVGFFERRAFLFFVVEEFCELGNGFGCKIGWVFAILGINIDLVAYLHLCGKIHLHSALTRYGFCKRLNRLIALPLKKGDFIRLSMEAEIDVLQLA